MSDKGKAVGGAALGGAGIVAALLKGGAAEVGVAKSGLKVAAGAGMAEHGLVTGAKGIGALEGASVAKGVGVGALEGAGAAKGIGALEHAGAAGGSRLASGGFVAVAEHGAPSFERATLFSASDLNLTTVASHGAEPATKGGVSAAKVVGGSGEKVAATASMTKSARTAKVHDVLEHAVDAKDLVERLGDVWDLAQGGIDDDEEKRVTTAFQAKGLDFRRDVVPAFQGASAEGVPQARRELLTDGHGLVPALKLPAMPTTARFVPLGERQELGRKLITKDPTVVVYATSLELAAIPRTASGVFLVTELMRSHAIVWHEIPVEGATALPRVLTIGDRRYASILPPPQARSAAQRVFVIAPDL